MTTVADLLTLLDGTRALPYAGEAVDQLSHALQCAGHALAAGADPEVVAACAFHDVGRAEAVRTRHRGPHEQAGAAFLRPLLGERVAWLVGAHVAAKRYLVATDPAYAGALSPASVGSLRTQGGPMAPAEVDAFAAHPWFAAAVALRRWDEAAKAAGAPAPALADLEPALVAAARR